MELQYKQQTLHNNLKSASYASGGLQSHTWELEWGPQGLEQAIKRIGMSPVITQNFSTDPMGRILSMTYQDPSYNGELYFHYDVQGNTSLLTDSNGQAVASFRFDHHNGQLAESWNPNNLELVNLKNGRQGSIRITTAVTGFDRDIYIPSWPPIEINPLPVNGNGNGNDWGGIGAAIGIGAYTDTRVTDTEKDCGDMETQSDDRSCEDILADCVSAVDDFLDMCNFACGANFLCSAGCATTWAYLLLLCRLDYNDCVKKRNKNNDSKTVPIDAKKTNWLKKFI